MAKTWDAWLPDVLPHVAGCPDVLASHEIKRAAQQFFRQSRAWRAVLDPLTLDVGEPELRVFSDIAGSEIVRIEKAALGSEPLGLLSLDDVSATFGPDWAAQTGTPLAVTALTPLSVRLVPYPDAAVDADLLLTVSLVPSETASGIPDELYAAYREQIATGAKSRLMLIKGQAWFDPEYGTALAGAFAGDIAAARLAAARATGRGRISARISFC